MSEPVRQDLQDRMGNGTKIVHQASGWLAQRKRMFKAEERRRGTFLIVAAEGKGAMPVFLAVEDEASMQADLLPLYLGKGGIQSNGDEIVLSDGQRLVFAGGYEAAVSFLGALALAST